MKFKPDAILHLDQALYLQHLVPSRSPVLAEMEAYAKQENIPISDPEVAQFLDIVVRSIQAKKILEIGTAIGYGAILFAQAAGPDGKVHTIDPDHSRLQIALSFIEKAGFSNHIDLIQDKALEALPKLNSKAPFDLIYIDAVKEEYPAYLGLVLPLLREGGLLIADNVLWKGQVASGNLLSSDQKASTQALQIFNTAFTTHPNIKGSILPLSDGIAFGIKTA